MMKHTAMTFDSARRLAHLEEVRGAAHAAALRLSDRVRKTHEEIQEIEAEIRRQERGAKFAERPVRGEPKPLGALPGLQRRLKEAKATLADLIPKRDAATERLTQAAGLHEACLEYAKENRLPTALGHDIEGDD